MKKNQLFLGLATIAAAVFSFSSCSQDELSTTTNVPAKGSEIHLTTDVATTRSVSQNIQDAKIASGVKVGVFVTETASTTTFNANGQNNLLVSDGNEKLKVDATDTDHSKTMYFPVDNTKKIDIYGYAPYNSSWTSIGEQTFTVMADQSSESNYLASDLLYANPLLAKQSDDDCKLPFKHMLSKININITNNRSGLNLEGAKVYIRNTQPTVTINLGATEENNTTVYGKLGAASGDKTVILAATLTSADINTTDNSKPTATASAIVVPQTVPVGNFIKIVTDASNNNGTSTSLYAYLGTEKKLDSGEAYSYKVTIAEEAVELTIGTSLTGWGSNDNNADANGASYGIGDYVLKDGTFVKKSEVTSEQKSNVAAIIFSTTSSDGGDWDGYAMSVVRSANRKWPAESETITGGPSTLNAALNAYNGMTLTNAIVTKIKGEAESVDWTTDANKDYFVNFTGTGTNGFSNTLTGANLSGWFAPSFGQMIQILNELGGANFKESDVSELKNNSAFFTGSTSDVYTTINKLVKDDLGLTNDVIPTNTIFTTATENGTSFWYVKFTETNNYLELGRSAGKSQGGRSVLPIVAYQLP